MADYMNILSHPDFQEMRVDGIQENSGELSGRYCMRSWESRGLQRTGRAQCNSGKRRGIQWNSVRFCMAIRRKSMGIPDLYMLQLAILSDSLFPVEASNSQQKEDYI